MKNIIFAYFEGSEVKLAVLCKEKEKVRVLKTVMVDIVPPSTDGIAALKIEGGSTLNLADLEEQGLLDKGTGLSNVALINDALKGIDLSKCFFVPTLTEPSIYYHIFENSKKEKSSKITQDIINDIQQSKNVTIDKENLGYMELADKSILSAFLSGDLPSIRMINNLAKYNGKRYYKIPAVKSAEVSLAYYAAKRKKFFPDDQSLIVYIGKEYSKLIFLQGRKLKHIGSTLDIGTLNLHTYDVYFSKILLEMENGGMTSLDNIVVCGEDDSENLILSFYGTFPEANVSRLDFDDLDVTAIKPEVREQLSFYAVPIAAAIDYFDELEESHKGINLVPKFVREEQKFLQFAWHGFAILPLLFIATFYFTQKILVNSKKISQLNDQVTEQTYVLRQNQAILSKIHGLQNKIGTFSQTQTILDSASVGTGIWSRVLSRISDFFANRRDIWLTSLSSSGGEVVLNGYAKNRKVLTDFAYSLKDAQIKTVTYEVLRDKDTYKYQLTFSAAAYKKNSE
jgi:Tfp pilus assembly protein PilN